MAERTPRVGSGHEREQAIQQCYESARKYLDKHRIKIGDEFIQAKKYPFRNSETVYKKEEVLNDRAEVDRLQTVFQSNNQQGSESEQKKYDEGKKISDIFEAMFADIAKNIFEGDVEVLVPSHFDDFKRQTDLVVVFKDETGKPEATIVVDFTTQQDVDGYTTDEGHRGGLDTKWAHSLKGIASKHQSLHTVKYGKSAGVPQELSGAPRVLIGLSVEEIMRMAPQWHAGSLNILADNRVRELSDSIQRQLVVQMRLAKKYKRDGAYQRIRTVVEVANARTKKIAPDIARASHQDPVIEKINGLLKVQVRDEHYEQARQAQEAFESTATRAEWRKNLNEPLSVSERAHLEKHLAKADPSGDILAQLDAFIAGKPHTLHKGMLVVLAAGVPTRLWRRLHSIKAIEPPKKTEDKTHEETTHEERTHHNENTAQLDVSTHLALLKKASGVTEEKYAQLDTRGKRIWSFIKEKTIRGLVAGVGSAIGSGIALALCAPIFPSLLAALGGAIAGSMLAQHLMKKYYYNKHPDKDHSKDRARVAVIQSLSRWAQANPYSFAKLYGGPQGEAALKKDIDRKVFLRNLAGNALAVGAGTLVGLEVRTGGQFTKTLASGDFDALWKLFYCEPTQRRSGVPIDDTPRRSDGVPVGDVRGGVRQTPAHSLGRGMYAQGAMYTFETPRARLPAWLHQQCIGQCTSTAPWGYHSWMPGRVNASGQQLYQLRYTPR